MANSQTLTAILRSGLDGKLSNPYCYSEVRVRWQTLKPLLRFFMHGCQALSQTQFQDFLWTFTTFSRTMFSLG